jgi:hypothetical protein
VRVDRVAEDKTSLSLFTIHILNCIMIFFLIRHFAFDGMSSLTPMDSYYWLGSVHAAHKQVNEKNMLSLHFLFFPLHSPSSLNVKSLQMIVTASESLLGIQRALFFPSDSISVTFTLLYIQPFNASFIVFLLYTYICHPQALSYTSASCDTV